MSETQISDKQRLQEIERRYQVLDAGPWQWRQVYGIGSRLHWALESPKSAADGKVVSGLLVLWHMWPEFVGTPVEDDPYLKFIAHSRDDIEWLRQRVAALERQLASVTTSDEIREAIRDALRQRKFDIYDACGDDTEKAERLCARYDNAFEWLATQGTGKGVSDGN